MKQVVRGLLGLLVLVAFLFGTVGSSRLLILGVTLYQVLILISVFSRQMRVHWFTRELQVVMLLASIYSLLLLLAGIVLLVRIPVSATRSIGIEHNFVFFESVMMPRSPRFVVAAQPKASFGIRIGQNTGIPTNPPIGWERTHVPAFMPAMLIAVPALLAWLIRMKPVRAGRCAICDYDLTGNTSGTCPECGTTIAAKRSPGASKPVVQGQGRQT